MKQRSALSPQLLCSNLGTWAHDVQFHIADTNEQKSDQQDKPSKEHNINGHT